MAMDDRSIRLHEPSTATIIRAEDVYFTFATGRLSYDCVTCNAKCCRGFGYLATAGKELERQLEMRPSLPLFVEPESNPRQYRIANCALGSSSSQSGACAKSTLNMVDAKPETCGLFPFNNLRRIGRYLVVRPHPSLCPLEVVSPGGTSECSTYGALLDAMSGQGIAACVPQCTTDDANAEHVIAFERRIVDLSEQFLQRDDYLQFVREQLRLHEAGAAPSLEAALQVVRELTDVPEAVALGRDADLVRTMVAVTPFLRSQVVFRDAAAGIGPGGLPLDYGRVAIAVRCIYLFAEAARASGMHRVTFQTVSKLALRFRLAGTVARA